jgi:hypothetical protein
LIQTEKPSGDAPVAEVAKLLIPKPGTKSGSQQLQQQLTLQEPISSSKKILDDEKI